MLRIDKKTFTCDFIIDISNVEIRRSRKEKKFLKIYSFVHFRFHIFRIYFVKWNYLEILRIYRREFRIIFPENFLRFNSTEIQLLRLPYDSNFCNIFLETSPPAVIIQIPIFCRLIFSTLSQTYFFLSLLPPEKFQ